MRRPSFKFNKHNKIHRKGLIIFILLMIIVMSSLFASLIQSDFTNVDIETVYLDTRDNQTLAYDIYHPDGVTEENQAPLVIVKSGFKRSIETQENVSLELAKRGFVVISIDPYIQGYSSSSSEVQGSAIATNEGYGAFDLIDYIYDNDDVYPFIDKDRIGVTGHSAGGNAALQAAIHFGKESVNNDGTSKVHSVFVSGYVLSIRSDISFANSNLGMDYALYDEGAFRNQVNDSAPEDASKSDLTWAIESHDFINAGLEKEGAETIPYSEQIEIGKIYGNPNLGNMRQVFNTETIHAFQPYSVEATGNIINYFEIAMNFRSAELAPTEQVWIYKEVLTTISLVASLAMIVPIAVLLYEIPFFKKSLRDPVINKTQRSKKELLIYVALFVVAATFAAMTYLPASKLTFVFFEKASNSIPTWFFPQRMTNAVTIWAVISGSFSALLFVGTHIIGNLIKKKKQATPDDIKGWGIKMPFIDVLKTFLIGILVIIIYFGLLNIIQSLFTVDYRFIFVMAARRVNLKAILQLLMYFPLFFVFYFSNSIRVNGSQMNGKLSETTKLFLAGLMNISGLAIILFIQYLVFARTGTIAFTELPDSTTQWLYVNILFTLLPVMFLMPFFNRWFYKLSGNSYLGPIIICGIFILMAISNSVAYIPN
mgnify:CR=1 FL=1